jgi:hypothetical protein
VTGPSTARAERVLARHGYDVSALPHLGDGVVRQVGLLDAYGQLVAVSVARAEFLGELLAAQFAAARTMDIRRSTARADAAGEHDVDRAVDAPDGAGGLIGHTYSVAASEADGIERIAVGEEIRALARLEAEERDRAAKLIRDAIRLGIELHQAEALRTYGASIAASLQALVRELGLDEHSPEVNRAAQRAVFVARRQLGTDEGDPDVEVGPPLTEAERVRALTRR